MCNSHIVSYSTWPGVTYKRSGEFLGPICITSLVPRLPCSGTRTLKLCRRGEPGIFCHMKSAKGREEVERTSLCVGVRKFRTGKIPKVAGNLVHI